MIETPLDVDTMPAGRELDAEIARRVFGLHIFRELFAQFYDGWVALTDEKLVEHDKMYDYRPLHGDLLLSYSTRIEDAWKIVEHIADGDQDFFSLYRSIAHGPEMLWESTFGKGSERGYGYADMPALAICRAALRSVSQGRP